MRSPSLMKGGTWMVAPFSSLAGLLTFETVEPLSDGSVSTTVSSSEGGSSMPIGAPSLELRLDAQARREPLRGVAKFLLAEGGMFVVLSVHEVVLRAAGV